MNTAILENMLIKLNRCAHWGSMFFNGSLVVLFLLVVFMATGVKESQGRLPVIEQNESEQIDNKPPVPVYSYRHHPADYIKEVHLLALAMYFEARDMPDLGAHVADVIFNRIRHKAFPNTIKEVITQGGEKPGCQFSFYCDGKPELPQEARVWQEIKSLAYQKWLQFKKGTWEDSTFGSHSYHTVNVAKEQEWDGSDREDYFNGLRPTIIMWGGHILYTDR